MSVIISGETFRTFSGTLADDITFTDDERVAIEMEIAILSRKNNPAKERN